MEKSKLDYDNILDKIRTIEKERNITAQVAALFLCKEYEIVLDDFLKDIEEK